jgi:hypothetical protein
MARANRSARMSGRIYARRGIADPGWVFVSEAAGIATGS